MQNHLGSDHRTKDVCACRDHWKGNPTLKPHRGIFTTTLMAMIVLTPTIVSAHQSDEPPAVAPVGYRHGDCSWVRPVALRAGWQSDQIPKLITIIKRESGCCPARRGGDIVDKNCKVIGHDGSDHKGDSGLLQINYVNYNSVRIGKTAYLCAMRIACSQSVLLLPYVNLLAGRALYQLSGWDPWDPCAWGKKYVKQCRQGGMNKP